MSKETWCGSSGVSTAFTRNVNDPAAIKADPLQRVKVSCDSVDTLVSEYYGLKRIDVLICVGRPAAAA